MVDGPIGHPGIHVRTPADKGPVSGNATAATQYPIMGDITVMDNPTILKLAMLDLVLVKKKDTLVFFLIFLFVLSFYVLIILRNNREHSNAKYTQLICSVFWGDGGFGGVLFFIF